MKPATLLETSSSVFLGLGLTKFTKIIGPFHARYFITNFADAGTMAYGCNQDSLAKTRSQSAS